MLEWVTEAAGGGAGRLLVCDRVTAGQRRRSMLARRQRHLVWRRLQLLSSLVAYDQKLGLCRGSAEIDPLYPWSILEKIVNLGFCEGNPTKRLVFR